MRGRRGFPEGFSAYNCRRELSLGWVSSKAIGHRGRCLGTASWAGSRGTDGSVGGWPVWSRGRRFQSTCRRNGVQRGQLGASQCKARSSSRRWHVAVQVLVQSGARWGAGARERLARSGRAGRLARAMLAWTGRRTC
jgi:hypothetical protein